MTGAGNSMHYVPKNYQNNELGVVTRSLFGGPVRAPTVVAAPAPAPAPTTMGPAVMPTVSAPPGMPYYDPAQTFTYTREQLEQMRDTSIAAKAELLERQGREGGDGIYNDLEQRAIEENATDDAIAAGAAGAALPARGAEAPEANLVPLALAAAAAYFFLL